MVDRKSHGYLVFILAMLGLMVAGIIGLVNLARTATPVLVPRITDNIPYVQEAMFNEVDQYPVIVEAPKEIRPGTELILTVRGAKYQNISEPLTITFTFSADNLSFVKTINPIITHTLASGNSWLLAPHEIKISTINMQSPPENFIIKVVQTIKNNQGQVIEHSPETIIISIDHSPVPSVQIAQALKSLLAFLIGTFGVFVASKLFD